jgi:2-haloacid dehalogenase
MDFSRFECLTFDCYGTLVDWESGILASLRPVLRAHGLYRSDDGILALYAELESAAERGAFKRYREVLREVMRGFGVRLGFQTTDQEIDSLPNSVATWPPFPDTVAALHKLKQRFRLAIVSNVDDELFAGSASRLKVPFDFVITAQQVGSYKPSLNNFNRALERIGLPRERVCHVAQSLYHDIAPARQLGLTTVWINRRHGRSGSGATPNQPNAPRPDAEFPDLASFAAAACD